MKIQLFKPLILKLLCAYNVCLSVIYWKMKINCRHSISWEVIPVPAEFQECLSNIEMCYLKKD